MSARRKNGQTFRINTEHLIRCLSADLGSGKGDMLTSDMSIEDADKWSLRRSLLKKFEDVTSPEASQRAIDGFLADNERCCDFKLESKRLLDDYLIGEVQASLDRWLHDSDGCPATLMKLTDLSRCGPGSSVDVDMPAFYTKLFDSTLATSNPDLRRYYATVISQNPSWAHAENWREGSHGSRTVLGSNLSTVRKQFDIDRTIATEPPLEMFFQLGIGGFLETDVLRPLGINLATQPDKNRELARIGSIDGTFGTIDLRSASNSISLGLQRLFPEYFWRWLMRCRSAKSRLPDGKWVDLHMVASMGNGYCFPLQTMLFASIVVACYRLMNIEPIFGSDRPEGFLSPLYGGDAINCGVFGDDIIVRREAYELVCTALRLFGFQVNDTKSYNSGPFRESCGHDYFRGTNIRGVYIKTMTQRSNCYSLINRLARWSVRTKCPMDFTLCYLIKTIGFSPIPFIDGDDEGVKVPSKWWKHRVEAPATFSQLYWGTTYRAERIRVPAFADDSVKPYRDYACGYNAHGIMVALAGGYIRGGFITIRGDKDDGTSSKCPEVRLRSIPFWDHIPTAVRKFDLRGESWEAYVDSVLALALPMYVTA